MERIDEVLGKLSLKHMEALELRFYQKPLLRISHGTANGQASLIQ